MGHRITVFGPLTKVSRHPTGYALASSSPVATTGLGSYCCPGTLKTGAYDQYRRLSIRAGGMD